VIAALVFTPIPSVIGSLINSEAIYKAIEWGLFTVIEQGVDSLHRLHGIDLRRVE